MAILKEILSREIGKPGKSKTYIASEMGVSEKTIENYMNGKRHPKPDALVKLSSLLGFSLAELSEHNVPERNTPALDRNNFHIQKIPPGLTWEQYAKKLEEDKVWLQNAMQSSLAAVLKGVGELAEGQKDLLAYQQGWLNHLEGSALLAAKEQGGKKGSGAAKKNGKKTGTRVP